MKHLKKIDELFKSTYKSAADKLKRKHPMRSKIIMNWAEEKGDSELKKFHIDRQWPHKFEFDNESLVDIKDDYFLGSFSIIEFSKPSLRQGYEGVFVEMINDWGQRLMIRVSWSYLEYENWFNMKINFDYSNGKYQGERDFEFNNRKDAIQFKKYLIEIYENDEIHLNKSPRDISINSLYRTE